MTRLMTAFVALVAVTGFSVDAETVSPAMQARGQLAQAQQNPPPGSHSHAAADPGSADQGYMQAMQRMQQDMPKQHTGNPDADFVGMMIPHHQSAVDMAKIELQYGKDPEIRKMAEEIIKGQEREISELRRWQEKHRQ